MPSVSAESLEKYTLIITEKPDTANKIANALDGNGKAKKIIINSVPNYQAYNKGKIVVVPALGHLYTITSKQKGKRDYPVFDYQWVPRYQAERKASLIKVWLKVISDLAKKAETFVDACDFDIEGSIIGYNILKYACNGKEQVAKRMKYSTLTKEELQQSYSNLLPHLDFALVEAGLTRHEVDWLYGINLSRALTQAAQHSSGHYSTFSTGRVQGPTLKFVEKREKNIQAFVPIPYWKITASVETNGIVLDVEYEKTLETLSEASRVKAACKNKEGLIVAVNISMFEKNPPVPFDLTTMQSEAYRVFRYTPMRTSNVLQRLYLNAMISYPRTSSQKLPASIGYQTILKKLSKAPTYTKAATELLAKPLLKPNEGKKFDAAHPAIYPTGNLPEKPLDTVDRNIFDLVVKRFFAVFGEPALKQSINAKISIDENIFLYSAERTMSQGWIKFYNPYIQFKEISVPVLAEGKKVNVKRVALNSHFTNPPARFNPRSLLMKMEKEQIGTKATRATTIQTLFNRKYLSGTANFAVTDIGFKVTEVLSKYCPTIISPELTKNLEKEMEAIQQGKQTKQSVLQTVTTTLSTVATTLKEKEEAIGTKLSLATLQLKMQERSVGVCSECTGGELIIQRSKKSGKRFVGCTNYFEGKCKNSFPLPQKGTIKPLGNCKCCGSPSIAVYGRGKKPWKFCLNQNCPTKGEPKR
jgi:DNA topoisomerase-1